MGTAICSLCSSVIRLEPHILIQVQDYVKLDSKITPFLYLCPSMLKLSVREIVVVVRGVTFKIPPRAYPEC